ncbi:MAG: DUF4215 domain-containing protein [Myxococcales bacterium]
MAFDPLRQEVLVFGGRPMVGGDTCATCGLWRWNGTRWRMEPAQHWPDGAPPGREGQALAYDPGRGRAVMFGGGLDWEPAGGYSKLTFADDTWEWDGAVWSRRCDYSPLSDDCGTHPPVPSDFVQSVLQVGFRVPMAAMPANATEVLFTGGQTWTFDGLGWSQRCSPAAACLSPRQRVSSGMVWHAGTRRLLMVGGADPAGIGAIGGSTGIPFFPETWSWTGLGWQCLAAGTPQALPSDPACPAVAVHPAGDGGAVYDPRRDVVIWFGYDAAGEAETLEWDGATWTRVPIADPEGDGGPQARRGQALVYSSALQRTLLFGGMTLDFRGLDDLWAYDGSSWRRLPLTDREDDRSPAARRYAGAVDLGDDVWLHAGFGARVFADLWRLDPALGARPGHVALLDYASSGGPSPWGCALSGAAGCKVASVEVLWRAGGTGRDAAGAALDGAQLKAWRSDAGWTLLAENAQRAPGELAASIVDPAALDALFFGQHAQLAFSVVPRGGNARGEEALVASDYLEVAVTFEAAEACGDGVRSTEEECDDGNRVDGDGCDSNCTTSRCGNAVAAPPETCDDGNTVGGDGCSAQCLVEGGACGDGVRNAGEECDDHNPADGDGCDSNCTVSRCGNAVTAPPETCDDGNLASGDGCSALCLAEGGACGDGVRNAGEECDDHDQVDGDGCDSNCTVSRCGNGVVAPGETCDDGNLASGDGCSAQCLAEGGSCGDGVRNAGEECDDHDLVDGDGCDRNCTRTACGNGVRTASEACDDGNHVSGDGCDANCTATGCGNGEVSPGESCDDGNTTAGDGCSASCLLEGGLCGDAIHNDGEECDDGDSRDFDGCSSDCRLESSCLLAQDATSFIGGATTLWGSTIGRFDQHRPSCGYGESGPEMVYAVTAPADGALLVTTDHPGTDYDTDLYVRSACDDPSTELGCARFSPAVSPQGATQPTLGFPVEAGKTYYVFVDGLGSGLYELSLEFGSSCAQAKDVTAQVGGAPVSGTTVGAFDQVDGSCSYGLPAGGEAVYTVTPSKSGTLSAMASFRRSEPVPGLTLDRVRRRRLRARLRPDQRLARRHRRGHLHRRGRLLGLRARRLRADAHAALTFPSRHPSQLRRGAPLRECSPAGDDREVLESGAARRSRPTLPLRRRAMPVRALRAARPSSAN